MGEENTMKQDAGNAEKNKKFSISKSADGIYLTVFPPEDGGLPVDEQVIKSNLQSQGVTDYFSSAITDAVKNASGEKVKVAELLPEEAEPEIQVLISRDKMEASLQVDLPKGCHAAPMDKVMDKVNNSGVVFGINQDAIKQACEKPGFRVIFAVAQRAVDGTDAKINMLVDLENKGRPVQLEDGKVDYKNLNIFTVVQQDDVLAVKTPATPGTSGTDIMGQTLLPKPGKDIPLPLGKNVTSVDKLKIVAAIPGQLQVVNNKINVVPVIEIKEDVDLSTGNIEFIGNVIVRGSIQQDFFVKAQGNVEVNGTVSGGTVEGKNIIIKMGIQGMHRGHIKAQENVVAKYIENATVIAGNDILVSDVILHSQVSAGKRVVVEGKRGLITGGTITAGEEIRAQTVGTHISTATSLEVGVNPMLREEYQQIRKEIKKMEGSLDQTQKALNILKSMDQQSMPPEKREMLLKMTKAQFQIAGQVENMRNRMSEIELALEEMRYGRIKVANVIYPGVKIMVGTLVKPIRENLKFVSLYAEDGEIKVGTYK